MRILQFQHGTQAYGLPLEAVDEVVPMMELTCPAQAPSILAGFLHLDGQAVPVVRLGRLFEVPEVQPRLYTPVVVVRTARERLAFAVDKVCGIAKVLPASLMPVAENHAVNASVTGLVQSGDETVLLLSAERLLLNEERIRLEQLAARETQRLAELEGAPT